MAENNFELIRFANDTALASSVAERLVRKIGEAKGEFSLALSGGRITKPLCEGILEQSRAQSVSLGNVHFFWADERCVPPHDPESNFLIAEQRLFAPLGLADERIHRIRGELNCAQAAAEAEADIRRTLPEENGFPVIDLVLLGLGEDGHTASLFPSEPEKMIDDPAVYRSVIATKPPPARVTLGYRALAAAREVWMLASGVGKEEALKNSLSGKPSTPFGRLLRLRRHTLVLTDIPSAGSGS